VLYLERRNTSLAQVCLGTGINFRVELFCEAERSPRIRMGLDTGMRDCDSLFEVAVERLQTLMRANSPRQGNPVSENTTVRLAPLVFRDRGEL
jgi:hypothetical protein